MFAFAAFVNDREIESNKKLVLMIDINLNCDIAEVFGACLSGEVRSMLENRPSHAGFGRIPARQWPRRNSLI
jgi:hypothetical protein